MNQTPNVRLSYKQGRSDKFYEITLRQDRATGLYSVIVHYGRRGATPQSGLKNIVPLTESEARRLMEQTAAEKIAKGYQREGTDPDQLRRPSELSPPAGEPAEPPLPEHQLCNPIDPETLNVFVNSDRQVAPQTWWMQRKFDGVRAFLRKSYFSITAVSRTGKPVTLTDNVKLAALHNTLDEFVIDGEMCGETFYAFDLIRIGGTSFLDKQYAHRSERLSKMFSSGYGGIQTVPTARNHFEKRAMLKTLQSAGAEGVVFKDPHAPYQPGRPNSGGCCLKLKFTATATLEVVSVNKQRSISVAARNGQHNHCVGNVTIPPNHDVPKVGALVEVRYLYAYRDGDLIQPVYLGERQDKEQADTLVSLQFKEERRGRGPVKAFRGRAVLARTATEARAKASRESSAPVRVTKRKGAYVATFDAPAGEERWQLTQGPAVPENIARSMNVILDEEEPAADTKPEQGTLF